MTRDDMEAALPSEVDTLPDFIRQLFQDFHLRISSLEKDNEKTKSMLGNLPDLLEEREAAATTTTTTMPKPTTTTSANVEKCVEKEEEKEVAKTEESELEKDKGVTEGVKTEESELEKDKGVKEGVKTEEQNEPEKGTGIEENDGEKGAEKAFEEIEKEEDTESNADATKCEMIDKQEQQVGPLPNNEDTVSGFEMRQYMINLEKLIRSKDDEIQEALRRIDNLEDNTHHEQPPQEQQRDDVEVQLREGNCELQDRLADERDDGQGQQRDNCSSIIKAKEEEKGESLSILSSFSSQVQVEKKTTKKIKKRLSRMLRSLSLR